MPAQYGVFDWIVTPQQAFTELYDDYAKRIYNGILALANRRAPEIEAWMKANAVWTDQTGNARQGLYAEVVHALTEIAILLDHGVDYGIYLETMMQGAYAIIAPALDYWSQVLWNDIKALLAS